MRLRVIPASAAPERGQANEATLELLAERLGVRPADVRVVAGHAARNKTVEVSGLTAEEAERRLSA